MIRQADDQPGDTTDDCREAVRQSLMEHGPGARRRLARKIPRRWRSLLCADDVMQQSYMDVFLHFERYEQHSDAAAAEWIAQIAENNLRDAIRMLETDMRGGGHKRMQVSVDDSYVALFDAVMASDSTPSRRAARNEMRSLLERAVSELPETYRLVVRMFDIEGRSMEETSRAVGRSAAACYMIRARAHRRLGELMGAPSNYFSSSR